MHQKIRKNYVNPSWQVIALFITQNETMVALLELFKWEDFFEISNIHIFVVSISPMLTNSISADLLLHSICCIYAS